jgi:hypothetical protein
MPRPWRESTSSSADMAWVLDLRGTRTQGVRKRRMVLLHWPSPGSQSFWSVSPLGGSLPVWFSGGREGCGMNWECGGCQTGRSCRELLWEMSVLIIEERWVCWLLLLNSVSSPPQWIRREFPGGALQPLLCAMSGDWPRIFNSDKVQDGLFKLSESDKLGCSGFAGWFQF